jgi:hypothetical protein
VNFLGWAVTSLLILAFVTPALINKKPVRQPLDYHPLMMWLLLNLLLLTGASTRRFWPVLELGCTHALAVITLSIWASIRARFNRAKR